MPLARPTPRPRTFEPWPRAVPASLHTRDRYDGFAAGVTLSRRDDTPWPVLQELLDDPRVTTEFRKVVARETTREEVLEVLRGDPSERVRRAVAKRSSGG